MNSNDEGFTDGARPFGIECVREARTGLCRALAAVLLCAAATGSAAGADGAMRASPDHIRIGLANDLESWRVPCCGHRAEIGGVDLGELAAATEVRPWLSGDAGRFTVQVSALRDSRQAERLAATLQSQWQLPSTSLFDAGSGTYKVRVGTYRVRQEAESLRDRLRNADHPGAWVVSEAVVDGRRGIEIGASGGEAQKHPSAWLRITRGDAVVFDGVTYRGTLWIYVNERGRLNVINELLLEDYLRGVVPREMGPVEYPEIEALKAQTIAARTYALEQLGAFQPDGFDLCATPKCQVYGGRSAEHALTDRAIRETQGEVLTWEGALAETLYSASCGGHTEAVGVPFPERTGEHLVAVPCVEAGPQRVEGSSVPPGTDVAVEVAARLTRRLAGTHGQGSTEPASEWLRAVAGLARLRGLRFEGEELAPPTDPSAVGSFLAGRFDLVLDRQLIREPQLLVDRLISRWRAALAGEEAGAAVVSRDAWQATAEPLAAGQLAQMVAGLAVEMNQVEVQRLLHQSIGLGRIGARRLDSRRMPESVDLRRSDEMILFTTDRLEPSADPSRSSLAALDESLLMPGDEIAAVVFGREVFALGVPMRMRTPALATRSPWRRRRSGQELESLIRASVPGFRLGSIEVVRRGQSGRVAELDLLSSSGDVVRVEGLAVRWTLDLPDTLFSFQQMHESQAPIERQQYVFQGRGWGHGVGLCQLGAVNMARLGANYRQILAHYYGGAVVQSWSTVGTSASGGSLGGL